MNRTTALVSIAGVGLLATAVSLRAHHGDAGRYEAKLTTVISDFMHRLATANRAEMREGTALIYARHFTASEIDHMIELQHDPVMLKMQAELPQIMAESLALSQASLDRETPRMMEQLKTIIEEYERNKGGKPST